MDANMGSEKERIEPVPDGPSCSDEELWAAFVEGDDTAVEVLIERYNGALFWYLLLSTGRQATAAQHLVRIWQVLVAYRRPFDGFGSFKAWLYAVATQQAVPATHPEHMGLTELLDDIVRGEPGSRRGEIFFRVAELSRHIRQPFLLVTVAGLSLAEAAAACNFTEERAAAYVEKAYRRLARYRLFRTGGGAP